MLYHVIATNFGFRYEEEFETSSDAQDFGRKKGFEFIVVTKGGEIIGWAVGCDLTWHAAARVMTEVDYLKEKLRTGVGIMENIPKQGVPGATQEQSQKWIHEVLGIVT